MKIIHNIVVTGGPCGGKTTVLDELTRFFRSEGYSVFVVSEVATELINDGVRPFGDYKFSAFDFQTFVIKTQIFKEEIRLKAANDCPNDNVVIIYDRGIIDNRAYLTEEQFQETLRNENLKEANVLSRYDMIIHMVSAAIGKEEFYTTLNNSARTETAEEAARSDRLTLNAWRNHPNLVVVNNDTLFEGKIQKVKNAVRSYLGEDEVIKQERYLVEYGDFDFDALISSTSPVKEEIEEFVKLYGIEEDEMYRKSTIDGSSYYTHIKNRYLKDGSAVKCCKNIGEEEYFENLISAKSKPINKVRYNVIDNGERYRIDLYDLGYKRFIILERDVVDASKKELPSFVKKAKDITDDRNYGEDSICIDYSIAVSYKKR